MAEKKEKKENLVGKLVIKLAGRDAGQIGVIVEELPNDFVLIDGSVRRRKCNLKHIEILDRTLDVKKGATHSDVVAALAKLGVKVVEAKPKEKKLEKKAKEEKSEEKKEESKKSKSKKKKAEKK